MQYILSEFELQELQDKANAYDDIKQYISLISPFDYAFLDMGKTLDDIESLLV